MSYIDPPDKLLHHVDRLAELRAGVMPAPINIEVDLSNRCSLGCEGCHFGYTHTRGPLANSAKPAGVQEMGDLMDVHMAKRLLDEAYIMGVRSVTWTGGGEPTLHPNFDEIISYSMLPQGVYTNGCHISPARARLMRARMAWVYVSLDYANRFDYKLHKKADKFEDAITGIARLSDAHGEATIGVGFLLWRENWTQAHEMMQLAFTQGADYVQFRPMILHKLEAPGEIQEDTGWMEAIIPMLETLKKYPGVIVDVDRFKNYMNWQGHGYKTCWWSALQTVITPNGNLWTCVNRRGFDGDCIGNLDKDTLYNIWQEHQIKQVDHDCRVFCRGHIPNTVLDKVMSNSNPHNYFV